MDIHASPQPVSLGCRVMVELVDRSGLVEQVEFTLVSADQADFHSGLLGEDTPLAKLLLGHHAGEILPYRAGDLAKVHLLAIQPGDELVSSQAASKRRKAVRDAAAQSEITNQMIFATASGSKWGDYDVDMEKLLQDKEKDEEEK